MRILLADDHAMMREGLKRILAEAFPRAQFGEAGTVAETLGCLRQSAWDVLVLDIFMPGGGGLGVLAEVTAGHPHPAVLVLSSAPEEQFALRTFRAGAAGYLNKSAASEELVNAIKKVFAGGRYASPKLTEKLVAEFGQSPPPALHERLSRREFQVLQMLAAGRSQKDMAVLLAVSPKTVSTFHQRILKKLRMHNDLELIHYSLEHHLLEQPATSRSSPS